jgi:microcystin degradation protein MlrC
MYSSDDGLNFGVCRDATASGASGDSNKILEALLQRQFGGRTLVPIVDAPAAGKAFHAGVGATLTGLDVGGTLDPVRFPPLRLEQAVVLSLHDGAFTYENGTSGFAGDVAVLRCNTQTTGSVDLLVVSQSAYFVGQACFKAFGLNPVDYDVVVVKSPNGFRPHYEAIAQQIIPVDVPGSTSANLLSLPYRNVQRPIFPLDREAVSPGLEDVDAAALASARL